MPPHSYAAVQQEVRLKIAIVDENAARAAVIEQGLRETGLADVAILAKRAGLVARLEALAPDVVLMSLGNPGRDQLEESFSFSRALASPIAMFVGAILRVEPARQLLPCKVSPQRRFVRQNMPSNPEISKGAKAS
ncbi:hypothetical protein [Sphingosinicella soli]|uniref:Chemotaxis response regulator CheB n=1 Tax=Sphingosinicella soli TaxID=333708 RepID=A0A7W7F7M4_9SPHN|nr:hypothetical protein [Sphingosinicella soli]MBB4633830.1 chemotaxis response regulator CheB [Sphingosinicella soli]